MSMPAQPSSPHASAPSGPTLRPIPIPPPDHHNLVATDSSSRIAPTAPNHMPSFRFSIILSFSTRTSRNSDSGEVTLGRRWIMRGAQVAKTTSERAVLRPQKMSLNIIWPDGFWGHRGTEEPNMADQVIAVLGGTGAQGG